MCFHAFFKRSLFLSTGNLIHFILGDQDSRAFGSMGSSNFSKIIFTIRSLCLIGFPFSLGFYSKDSIIGNSLSSINSVIITVFIISCCFTVCYRFRVIYIRFYNNPSSPSNISFTEELFFYLPVTTLFLCRVFLGNYFFFFYTSPYLFSLTERFTGILIIVRGIIIFKYLPRN